MGGGTTGKGWGGVQGVILLLGGRVRVSYFWCVGVGRVPYYWRVCWGGEGGGYYC